MTYRLRESIVEILRYVLHYFAQMTGRPNWKILFCGDGYVNVGNDKKKTRIIGIRYARMKRAFFASKCLEKKLKNDALNSIKGLSTTHC